MSRRVIGIRCDAGATTGVGHLIRCVALAEELTVRGIEVVFLGDLGGLAWARQQLDTRGLRHEAGPGTPAATVAAIERLGLSALVLDSYTLDPGCAAAARAVGVPVLAIVDGSTRGQSADLFLDQNLGASLPEVADPAAKLLGPEFALLRDSIRRARPASVCKPTPVRPTVLAFFGGTDAFGAAPVLTELLIETGLPWSATVIAGSPTSAAALDRLVPGPRQSLSVLAPTDDLPGLIVGADLVISASGTSTWELLCLGAAAALVWVVDNQRDGYHQVLAAGLAAGIGRLTEVRTAPGRHDAANLLRTLLAEPAKRADLAAKAFAAVDGRGRERVVDRLLEL